MGYTKQLVISLLYVVIGRPLIKKVSRLVAPTCGISLIILHVPFVLWLSEVTGVLTILGLTLGEAILCQL